MLGAPGSNVAHDLTQRNAGINGARIQGSQRGLLRESPFAAQYSEVASHQIEQVGAVTLVENSKTLRQTNGGVVASQCVVGHRVERSARDPLNLFVAPQCTHAANDVAGGPAREGQKKYSIGRCAALEKELHPSAQRGRFSSPGPRQDSEGPVAK